MDFLAEDRSNTLGQRWDFWNPRWIRQPGTFGFMANLVPDSIG
jgi:hypothetical protein